MDVAGVDEPQALAQADAAGARQRGRRCRQRVQHLVIGMECGEVHRHIDAEVLPDPRAFGGDLGVAVVASRNEQGGDLQPHVGLVPQVEQGVQHVVQTPDADLAVEVFGERLQVDVGGINVPIELGAGRSTHVSGRHRDGFDSPVVARIGDIGGVLPEDRRIVVGECHTATTQFVSSAGDVVGSGPAGQGIDLARLRDIPVLAKLAGEVAPRSAERQHRRTRQEVVERLLFHRVDAEPARPPVAGELHLIVDPAADEAQAALALVQLACARTDVALNPAVVEAMPVFRRDGEPVVFGNEWGHGVLSAPGYAPRSRLNTCWWSRPLVATALPPCGPARGRQRR